MNINWVLRLKNKATLTALIAAALAFAAVPGKQGLGLGYQVAGIFGVVPPVSQDALAQAAFLLVNILVALGVVVDPTTQGVGDSSQAMGYTEPKGE